LKFFSYFTFLGEPEYYVEIIVTEKKLLLNHYLGNVKTIHPLPPSHHSPPPHSTPLGQSIIGIGHCLVFVKVYDL